MTSAALADCQDAASDSASKIRTKRTVFMEAAPISNEKARARSGLQHQRRPKYRPRMKDLRRSVFASQQGCERPLRLRPRRHVGDGCVAMKAAIPPCGATIIEGILRVGRAGWLKKMPRSNGDIP